jgi:hypothetical protein
MSQQVEVVRGRNCDGCTMCCKLLSVAELDKPPVSWCTLCDVKVGCNAYAGRPTECRDFYCGYLLDPTLDERWKPSHCKLVVTREEQLGETLIHNDPARPDAWRREPFHSQILAWAGAAVAQGRKVIIWQGDAKIAVVPEAQTA